MPPLHRRNFLPTTIVAVILWIACGLIIAFLDPEKNFKFQISNFKFVFYPNIILFLLTLTLSLTLTLALLFGNTRRGVLTSLFLISLLLLRLFKCLYWWFIPILLVVTLTVEFLLSTRNRKRTM